MAEVEVQTGLSGQRRCGSYYSGFFSEWQIFTLPYTLFSWLSVLADGDGHEACRDMSQGRNLSDNWRGVYSCIRIMPDGFLLKAT